jgi:hypothetical protein
MRVEEVSNRHLSYKETSMFTDPLTFVLSGTTHSLARVRMRERASDYQNAALTVFQTISHQNAPAAQGETGTVIRSLTGFRQRKLVTDVMNAERSEYKTLGIQVIVLRPEYGFDATELKALWTAVKTQMNDAFIDKVFTQES